MAEDCTCHRSAVEPCPTHATLREHATSLRLRLDTDRNDPARAALYAALQDFERAQRQAQRQAEAAAPRDDYRVVGSPMFTRTHVAQARSYRELADAVAVMGEGVVVKFVTDEPIRVVAFHERHLDVIERLPYLVGSKQEQQG